MYQIDIGWKQKKIFLYFSISIVHLIIPVIFCIILVYQAQQHSGFRRIGANLITELRWEKFEKMYVKTMNICSTRDNLVTIFKFVLECLDTSVRSTLFEIIWNCMRIISIFLGWKWQPGKLWISLSSGFDKIVCKHEIFYQQKLNSIKPQSFLEVYSRPNQKESDMKNLKSIERKSESKTNLSRGTKS